MTRRRACLALLGVGMMVAIVPGCGSSPASSSQFVRKKTYYKPPDKDWGPPTGEHLAGDPNGGEEDPTTTPRGFFKSTRKPAALSDEAREIERNLGVRN